MNDNNLKVGDVVYILGKYTLDGDTKVVEVKIQKTWKNGKVLAYTTGNEPGEWNFRQSDMKWNCIFRTREEAERILKEEQK